LFAVGVDLSVIGRAVQRSLVRRCEQLSIGEGDPTLGVPNRSANYSICKEITDV
jgi:hypothetical protein